MSNGSNDDKNNDGDNDGNDDMNDDDWEDGGTGDNSLPSLAMVDLAVHNTPTQPGSSFCLARHISPFI